MATGLTLSSSSSLSDQSSIVIAAAISNIEPAGPTNQLVSRYDIPQGSKQVNILSGVETMQQLYQKVWT